MKFVEGARVCDLEVLRVPRLYLKCQGGEEGSEGWVSEARAACVVCGTLLLQCRYLGENAEECCYCGMLWREGDERNGRGAYGVGDLENECFDEAVCG